MNPKVHKDLENIINLESFLIPLLSPFPPHRPRNNYSGFY